MTRLIAVLCMLCVGARAAQACSCLEISRAAAFHMATDVFTGTVLSTRLFSEPIEGHLEEGLRREVIIGRVRVERSWKGASAGRVITVYTSPDGASCGVDLPRGHEVVLFAHRLTEGVWKGRLALGRCGQPSGLSPETISDSLGAPTSVRKETGRWPWK